MNAQELLSEDESARRAGVSVSTLRQFADFGFLSRFEENGEGRYRLNDLVSVFSLTDQTLMPEPAADSSSESIGREPSSGEAPHATSLAQQVEVLHENADLQDREPSHFGERVDEAREVAEPQPHQSFDNSTYNNANFASELNPGDFVHNDVVHNIEHTQDSERDDRLGTTYELLALNKRLREELKSAKEERDWLRARLEKLEARTERDQMLLLAESQTIRQLVTQVEKEKRSIWSMLALPWSGSQTK